MRNGFSKMFNSEIKKGEKISRKKYAFFFDQIKLLDLKTISVGFYFFSVIIFSYWHDLQVRAYFYSSVLLICSFIFHFIRTKEQIWFFNKYLILYYLLFLFCIISFLVGPKFENDVQMITSFCKVILSLFLISNLVRNRYTFIFVLLVISLSSWVIFYLNYDFILIAREETTRLYGFVDDPNRLAYILVTVIWATLCLCFIIKSKWKYLILINFIPCSYMIYLTGSRKSFISLAFLPSLVFIFHHQFLIKKNKDKLFVCGLYCVISILIVCGISFSPHSKRFKQGIEVLRDGSKSKIYRVRYTIAAYNMFKESPFLGKGFNQFRHIADKYHAPNRYSHSTLLELSANSGIVGLSLYFGSIFYLFFGIKKCLNLKIPEEDLLILRFGLILIILFFVLSIFAIMYLDKLYWPLLAVYAGYLKFLVINKEVGI